MIAVLHSAKESRRRFAFAAIAVVFASACAAPSARGADLKSTLDDVQRKTVKIYGAGGAKGLEAYQSGALISADGCVLTSYSYVLDSATVGVVLSDGRRFEGKLLGADPRLDVAVLKIDAADLPHFDLNKAVVGRSGMNVLAISNLYNVASREEPLSVQHGIISTVTKLDARRGAFDTPYDGPIYALDARTNNPGAAGGALVTRNGELLGMLGKELRNALNDSWLNYAVPVAEFRATVEAIRAGKFTPSDAKRGVKKSSHPLSLESLGLAVVPDVLDRTPPYVEWVRPGSSADKAGVRPDDLIVLRDGVLIQSCRALKADLETVDDDQEVRLVLLRGREMLEVSLRGDPAFAPPAQNRQ